jgi:AAA+ ATPase superfamily predicted ATPase
MKAALNPFNPGSGLRPPALVGRGPELDALDVIVERVKTGYASRGVVLSGLRGVGKTVLLNEMRNRAEVADWFVVSLEARSGSAGESGVRQVLAREISAQARQLRPLASRSGLIKKALEAVTSFNARLGGASLRPVHRRAPGP